MCTLFLLAATALSGEPIFDSRPGHPWDRVRDSFYIRQFSTGEVFENPDAFAPPHLEFYRFRRDARFYEQVCAALEAVEKLPPAQMEELPASRRLIFLRDMWAVFDGLETARIRWPVKDDKVGAAAAVARTDDLLQRVARIMRRLELTEDEVRKLPDTFTTIQEKQLYPKAFDPVSKKPFFPTDLLVKDGPWVMYSSDQAPSAGGVSHMNFIDNRSIFTLHLRTPGGREEGETYLKEYTQTDRRKTVPPGTTLALLRRGLVPTREGNLVVSPVIDSLQLIAATPPQDQRFKFTLDRRQFLAGELGLRQLGKDDPVDTSNFEALILFKHPVEGRTYDNGEMVIGANYKSLHEIPRSLVSCVKCHDETTGSNIFARSGPRPAYLQSDLAKVDATIIRKKETSTEWKLYQLLRASPTR